MFLASVLLIVSVIGGGNVADVYLLFKICVANFYLKQHEPKKEEQVALLIERVR